VNGREGYLPAREGMAIEVTARLDGDAWVINRQKAWPSNAGGKRSVGVYCITDPGLGLVYYAFTIDT